MINWTKSQAKTKRAVAIRGFVVLLGIMFNLACAQSATAGNSTDLNGDGKADIVWRNSKNGSTAIWLLNGATIASAGFPGGVPLAWKIAGIGDVNGDGKADVIWRHSTSATVAIWLMNGVTITSVGFPASVPTAWSLQAVGDVNGDGKADMIWRNSNDGNTAIWLMNGTKIAASGFLGKVPLAWQLAGVGDVDANGKADLIWHNGTSHAVAVWLMNGLTMTSSGFPGSASPNLQIVGVGDVNGDGKADLMWRNTSNGDVEVWLLDGTRIAASAILDRLPSQWQIVQVGDADGDGKVDVIWRDNNTGTVVVWLLNGLSISSNGSPGTTGPDWIIAVKPSLPSPPPTVSLAILITGIGAGTISCNGGACNPNYPSGTALTLVATPEVTSLFGGWKGACAAAGTAHTCKLTINANSNVTATFSLPTLSVVLAGNGTVTSNPVGIDCGTTCSASFKKGTPVTLTATGIGFSGWSGGGCAGNGTCAVTLTTNSTVTATFGTTAGISRYHFFTKREEASLGVGPTILFFKKNEASLPGIESASSSPTKVPSMANVASEVSSFGSWNSVAGTENFLSTNDGGTLMAVDPVSPTTTPITVASMVSGPTEVSSVGSWNSDTGIFENIQSVYEVYVHDGKLWRVNTATSAGLPGGPNNPPVQISSEAAATRLCNVLAIEDMTNVTNRLLFYELPGADGQCGSVNLVGTSTDNITKMVSLSDSFSVPPLTLPTGLILPREGSILRRWATSKIIYDLNTGVATHVFLVDAGANNTLMIINLSTKAIATIKANVGNRVRILAQDTSDRVFVLTGTNTKDTTLYVYTVSTNLLVSLVTATSGSELISPENASDGTQIYVGNTFPGMLYNVPLTATSATQVIQLKDLGFDRIKFLFPTTNRIYVIFQTLAAGDGMLSIPKSGGASRIDVPTIVRPRNQQQVVLVLEYTRNGLLFCLKFTADRTNPNLFPPPITSPTFFILAENGSIQSEQPSTSFNGFIFQPTVGVRGGALTLSRVLLSGFNGTTYTSSKMEVLDAATGNQGVFLGTVPATIPSISAWPFMLAFIDFINGSSLGFGFSRETQANTVFYLNTDEQNSLVQIPVEADQWWYTLRQ